MKDNEYKRCNLCNYTDMDETIPKRNFRLDKQTNEYHCTQCIMSIEDVLLYYDEKEDVAHVPYWKREKRGGFKEGNPGNKKNWDKATLDELLKTDGEIPLLNQEVEEYMEEDENSS